MTLHLGDLAPDFTAETTHGPVSFHTWKGSSWAVLFSHPRDFTPVCTTELGAVARLKSEFERRSIKIIGLSVDSVETHSTPANWQQGDDVIILPSVTDEEAARLFPRRWLTSKPYLRITPQPDRA